MIFKKSIATVGFVCILLTAASTSCSFAQSLADIEAIHRVLQAQQDAWNEGDYEGFMEGYWKSDSLTFASGSSFTKGWQTTLDNYKVRYPDRAAMGTLAFTIYETRILSQTDAFVFGRYELEREHDRPSGLFTLLFKKFGSDWKIVFDHTSTAPKESD